ncbi:antitoxin [Sphingomonas oligophenolica]|uniref:AbrB family transcriptional regulator n=1 Tax=Sphingomonas oligophenolica TaxID=301154 RepID=A0A502CGP2_9SPHN|nr:AbrB family transcriptional regulator [Sphingomonas oligophenolica]TPG12327.1 AbrB family transcriptional regulator [Sphingomonas oligophenolica]
MSKEYRAKVFKSGNSLALRLPKALGLREADDVVVVSHADSGFSFWRETDAAAVLDGLYGAFSPGFMAGGRDDIEQEERDWGKSSRGQAA